ncbi:YveK family protein, partial [Microbacterium sp. Bi128]|uniref:YveK family protein n=1 Tax=Microbacterium sp. Bi128 TaxID=2821115 RepID=UPI001E31F8CF
MDLQDYLRMLRRNWIIVVSAALVGLLAGAAATLLVRPTYTAQSQLFVAIQGSGTVSELQQGNTFSQARVQSYVKTIATPVVLQPVVETLGLNISASRLAGQVTATSDLNTVIITISAEDTSPVQAAAIAQAVADSLIVAVDTLERPKTGGTSPVSLSIIRPAEAPSSPSAPNVHLNLIIGLVTGLLGGVA